MARGERQNTREHRVAASEKRRKLVKSARENLPSAESAATQDKPEKSSTNEATSSWELSSAATEVNWVPPTSRSLIHIQGSSGTLLHIQEDGQVIQVDPANDMEEIELPEDLSTTGEASSVSNKTSSDMTSSFGEDTSCPTSVITSTARVQTESLLTTDVKEENQETFIGSGIFTSFLDSSNPGTSGNYMGLEVDGMLLKSEPSEMDPESARCSEDNSNMRTYATLSSLHDCDYSNYGGNRPLWHVPEQNCDLQQGLVPYDYPNLEGYSLIGLHPHAAMVQYSQERSFCAQPMAQSQSSDIHEAIVGPREIIGDGIYEQHAVNIHRVHNRSWRGAGSSTRGSQSEKGTRTL